MSIVFSAAQPTGRLHLGNYLGALRGFSLIRAERAFFAVADLHAITLPQDPAALRASVREAAIGFIACGIDPSLIFAQSAVPAHAQLGWVLTCSVNMGQLGRMTQFKEKSGKRRDEVSGGLFTYPALMAADILLYKATHVPVGDDQKQHLELTRDLAQRFNHVYGETFPLPEPLITAVAPRVMSLRDGTAKMSKSDPSDYARINLDDDNDTIALKIRKAKTDPLPLPASVEEASERPEALNLLTITAALHNRPLNEVIDEHAGQSFADFKQGLIELLCVHTAPIRLEVARYRSDPAEVEAILRRGAERAAAFAEPTLAEVYGKLGLT